MVEGAPASCAAGTDVPRVLVGTGRAVDVRQRARAAGARARLGLGDERDVLRLAAPADPWGHGGVDSSRSVAPHLPEHRDIGVRRVPRPYPTMRSPRGARGARAGGSALADGHRV